MRHLAKLALLVVGILGVTILLDAQDLGFDTTYYYDLYGSQVQDKDSPYLYFPVRWNGKQSPKVKGPYKARTYQSGKLTVTVYYKRPELRAVAVEYRLTHYWTEEQIRAALTPYGSSWKALDGQEIPAFEKLFSRNQALISPDGVIAHFTPYMKQLIILSPTFSKNSIKYSKNKKRI
jgi:hypothetical protein